MATTAAVVAAGATVAAAGAQAAGAASSGKGGGGPSVPETPLWERIFSRGTADLLDEERRVMEDALGQANFLQPELYALLGYEPVYATEQAKDVAGLSEKANAIGQKLNETIASLNTVKAAKGKKAKRAAAEAAGFKNVAEMKRARADLLRQKALADRELGDAQALPRRVVGFRKLDQPADPTRSKGDLFRMALDLQNQTLVNALQGKEPIDATLRAAWDEKEKALRERLRRTLGPDYETSSAGIEALANLDRERNQSFEQYNREVIGQFSALTESRATALSNLTGAALQQMLFPANSQLQRGLLLGQAASDRNEFRKVQMAERGQQFDQKARVAEAEAARDKARADAIAGIGSALGGLAQGAAGFSGSSYAQSFSSAARDTVNVPSDYDVAINRYLGR
jgi:hypothetical protein